jgi:hypothetical protein
MSPAVRRQLHAARELLEIRLLHAALDAVSIALRLEHPSVNTLAEPTDPPTLRAARDLLVRVGALRSALRAYRATVRRVIAEPENDFPF